MRSLKLSRSSLGAALLLAAGTATPAMAQWTIVNLHPSWATDSEAIGIHAGQQAGIANSGMVAVAWTGSGPSGARLNPTDSAARADCVSGGVQGGAVTVNTRQHASLWSGTAGSWVDIHPSIPEVLHSRVMGSDGATQVGLYAIPGEGTFTAGRACMWNGSANTWVDLNPIGFATSEARGVFGNQQVGGTFDAFLGQACMWTGTPESFVILHPPTAFASVAQCTDGVFQYGTVAQVDPIPGIFPARWNGSALSWQDMGIPEGRWGEIGAVHGGYQAGNTTDTNQENQRAWMWLGTPGSYLDLHTFLPLEYSNSAANGIWRHLASGTTYVVGRGFNTTTNHNEALMWVSGPGVNLITSPSASTDCSAAPGETINYSVRVLNAGPDASGPVTLTVQLPAASAATFVSAVPAPTSVSSTQVTFDLAALAGLGAFTDVSLEFTAVTAGATATITCTAATAGESDPTNNTASASSRVLPAPPPTASARGVLSTNASLANSLIPGGAGRFTALNRPFASPSGNWWIIRADSDLPTTQDFVYIRSQTGGASSIVAQEGVTAMSNGILSQFDVGAEVNDSGLVAFAGDDAGPTATDRFIATTDGTTITDIAREGQPVPSMPGINYGSSVGASASIFANGLGGLFTNSTPTGSSAYLSDNGNAVVARLNVTTPNGAEFPIDTMVTNTSGVGGLAFDATGSHSIYQADINTGSNADDQVIVVDGTVVMQEGVTILPGMATAVNTSNKVFLMGGGGDWIMRGGNSDTAEDWVVRGLGTSILEVFRNGDPIHAGTTETWQEDVVITSTFFTQVPDAAGNFVVGGMTSSPDDFTDSVLVYNNQIVLARENDPIDLDGNGLFDDDAYIRTFDSDGAAFVAGGLLTTVTLRDSASALCRLNNTDRGQALIFIQLPGTGCDPDVNCDGSVNGFDIEATEQAVNGDFSNFCQASADLNGDGAENGFDIETEEQRVNGAPC